MIKTITSFKFPGFYESVFNSSDDFIDIEEEDGVEYDYEDFNQYKLDVSSKFMELYVDKLNEIIPDADIEIVSNVGVLSPQYYNYSTDQCLCDIEISEDALERIKTRALWNDEAMDYIYSHWSSYDGFISFISNDIDVWKGTPVDEMEDNMIIAMFDMLIELDNEDNFNDIIIATHDAVNQYQYIVPVKD